MDNSKIKENINFIILVTIYHTVTYFLFGIIASTVFNYQNLFEQPIISNYYKPFGSVAIYLGPLIQVFRGIIFGLVLLPLRHFLKLEKFGWLWLWLLFIGIGIISTPAAAPSSLEGLVYTKLPFWFHILGIPEISIQTLAFSYLVHRKLTVKDNSLPSFVHNLIHALVYTCFSFIGYTVVSLIFAFTAGVTIEKNSADLKVLGQFIMPILVTFVLLILNNGRYWLRISIIIYIISAFSIGFYQKYVLGGANILYLFTAPLLPVIILAIILYIEMKKVNSDKNLIK